MSIFGAAARGGAKGSARGGSRAANLARVRKLAEEEMKKAGRKGKSPVQNKPGVINYLRK